MYFRQLLIREWGFFFDQLNQFLMHAELNDFVNDKVALFPPLLPAAADCQQVTMGELTFGYGQGSRGSDRVRKAMADHINRYFKPHTPIRGEQVTFSAGVTAINDMVAWNLTDPGDGILLGMPIYGDFKGDLTTKAGYGFGFRFHFGGIQLAHWW